MQPTPETTQYTPDSKTHRAIERIREAMAEGDFAIDQAVKGADTELMADVKKLEEQPLHLATKSIEGHAAAFVQFFGFFVKKIGLSAFVASAASRIRGQRVSVRVFLKEENWNFETRSLFYQLIEQLGESRFFAGLSIDFLAFKVGDPDLPAAFEKLPI